MDRFHSLTAEEIQQVLDAPALITFLIGGADGKLDIKEIERAKKAVSFRSIKGDPLLFGYYRELEKDFDARLTKATSAYTGDKDARIAAISDDLSKLGPILSKLEKIYAQSLLKSWKNLAEAIASTSGGFFGFFGISSKEKELMQLNMISLDE